MPTLADVDPNCLCCQEYIERMAPAYRGGFLRQQQEYKLDAQVVDKLRPLIGDYSLVVVFADWCGDARKAVPVLALLEKELGIKIRALGGMTKPPYGSPKLWAVPPSPEEVERFEITSSPTLLVFDREGREIGRMKTRPRMTSSVEAEILKIIEDSRRTG
ncbi:MAG: thioredoxin family protein [Candidatus Thorarchaeota archaeon]|nr:thioredoxin family protein [Candidatus Thorarchaeota archaeon]